MRDGWFRASGAGVFDVEARNYGDYFQTDWLAGCVIVMVLVAVFILIRPWGGRLFTVLLAGALVAAVLAYVAPMSVTQWNKQEALTSFRLQAEPYPFSEHYDTCGEASAHFGTGTSNPKVYSLFSSRTGGNLPLEWGCNRLELWEGWRKVKVIDLDPGGAAAADAIATFKSPDFMHIVSVKEGEPLAKTTFTVELQSGKKLTYSLAKLLVQ